MTKLAELPKFTDREVPEDTVEILPVRRTIIHKIKKCAFKNALTIVVILGFLLTWIVILEANKHYH